MAKHARCFHGRTVEGHLPITHPAACEGKERGGPRPERAPLHTFRPPGPEIRGLELPRPLQDPPWKKPAPPSRFSAVGLRVLTLYMTSTGSEELLLIPGLLWMLPYPWLWKGERAGSTCTIDVEGRKRRSPSKVGGLCHEFRV